MIISKMYIAKIPLIIKVYENEFFVESDRLSFDDFGKLKNLFLVDILVILFAVSSAWYHASETSRSFFSELICDTFVFFLLSVKKQ